MKSSYSISIKSPLFRHPFIENRTVSYGFPRRSRGRRSMFSGAFKIRLIIAGVMVLFAVIGYFSKSDFNEITGNTQRVGLTEEQEIALGLQAVPSIIQQHHGYYHDVRDQQRVKRIGNELLVALNSDLASRAIRNPYEFDFHLLADEQLINAFALPGGQVFVTYALYSQLTDGQLAGVLAHEIGHVLERHGAERIAKQSLTGGIVGAAGVAGGDVNSARMAQMVGTMINMKYGRNDELESDRWGVRLTALAGYDPRAMIEVMNVLEKGSGGGPPAIFSTHPPPKDRRERIKAFIEQEFPNGLPTGLQA